MTDIHDTADLVSKALRRAWQLGQTYWQQADSEHQSHWKKADATQATFDQLVEDTRAAILAANSSAQPAPSEQDESVRKAWSRFSNELHRSPDAPYPGMSQAFEQHFSQSFTDREWRVESGTWAAAWKAAKRHEAQAQPAPSVPEGFSREDLEAVADGLDGYEKTVNVGNVTGVGDDHLESTTAYAARFIRAMLAAQPAQCFADAYQGAMEEVTIWKKRALEAEELNRKFIAEINSPTHMGEPAQPAPSGSSVMDAIIDDLQSQYDTEGITEHDSGDALIRLSDAIAAVEDNFAQPAPSVPTALLVAAADLVAQMEIVSRVGFIDTPSDKDSCAAFCVAEGTWLELMSAIESLASALAAAPEIKP